VGFFVVACGWVSDVGCSGLGINGSKGMYEMNTHRKQKTCMKLRETCEVKFDEVLVEPVVKM
jgi:hypothetical protein